MRAIVQNNPGDPSTLLVGIKPDPEPGDGEFVIRIEAVAIGHVEGMARRGMFPPFAPPPVYPITPGHQCVGLIESLGTGVTSLKVGQRVVGTAEACLAEWAIGKPDRFVVVPDSVDSAELVVCAINLPTAELSLSKAAGLNAGESVTVTGAGGGVGMCAVQLAVAAGARPLGIVGSDARSMAVADAGAVAVARRDVDGDVPRAVHGAFGVGTDVYLDLVAGPGTVDALGLLAPFGRYVIAGFSAGPPPPELAMGLMRHMATTSPSVRAFSIMAVQRSAFPEWVESVHRCIALVTSRVIVPRTTQFEGLHSVADAHRCLDNRASAGTIVVRVA
jgi:NADPH:quinone reductase